MREKNLMLYIHQKKMNKDFKIKKCVFFLGNTEGNEMFSLHSDSLSQGHICDGG